MMNLDAALRMQEKVTVEVFGFSKTDVALSEHLPYSDYPIYAPNSFGLPGSALEEWVDDRIGDDPLEEMDPDQRARSWRNLSAYNEEVWQAFDPRVLLGMGVGLSRDPYHEGFVLKLYMQRYFQRDRLLALQAKKAAEGCAEIEFTGIVTAHSSHGPHPSRSQSNSLRIGQFAAHHKVNGGTLGCFVERVDPVDGSVYALSNNHVFADQNRAAVGDPIRAPRRSLGGKPPKGSAVIAYYEDAVPLDFGPAAANIVDCAIAEIDPKFGVDHRGLHCGPLFGVRQLDPDPDNSVLPGMNVRKIGMGSQFTEGFIDAMGIDVTVFFDPRRLSRPCRFAGQLGIKGRPPHFSVGGDSGSLVISDVDRPVGLLFAGGGINGAASSTTFANPIKPVLRGLGCSFY